MTAFALIASLLVISAVFVLANLGEKHQWARIMTYVLLPAATLLLALLYGVAARIAFEMGSLSRSAVVYSESQAVGIGIGGALGLVLLLPPVRQAIARVIPIRADSPVHYAALLFALILFFSQLASQLYGGALAVLQTSGKITISDFVYQEALLLLIAPVGVGLAVRRSPAETWKRLGLHLPPARWWLFALLGIFIFLLVASAIDRAGATLFPNTAKQINDVDRSVFQSLNNPLAVLVLGGSAGIAEEVLFRGALLPRFGLILSSLLFAAVHTQYGLTFASLEVFVLGMGLGWMRQKAGTLPCIVTHAGYDIVVGLIGLAVH